MCPLVLLLKLNMKMTVRKTKKKQQTPQNVCHFLHTHPLPTQKQDWNLQERPFWKNLLLVLRSGWGRREVGGVWEILVTTPLFFSTVPSRGRSKPGQESAISSNQPASKLVGLN